MINLLPQNLKSDIMYAKRNTVLVKWVMIVVLGIVGLYAILGIGYFYLQTTAADLNEQLDNQAGEFSQQQTKQIETEVKDLETSVELASDVLSRQLLFSKLLTSIGNVLPEGTRLATLEINDTDQAIDLRFDLKNDVISAQLAANLGDPTNRIFSSVDIVSVDCDSIDTSEYPCTASLRALFADNSNFRVDLTDQEDTNE